jgi:hypothetical protein
MLRITVVPRADEVTVALEGRLIGPWVTELADCWSTLRSSVDPRAVRIELDAVTFIDAAGKELLRTLHAEGATLAASGCMTRAILEEIQR